jgi:hypothetical protein
MNNFGKFSGYAKTEWIDPKRKMRLLEDFIYTDPVGKQWNAPKDSIIDGASIPRLLWSFVGGPFEGEYRDASIVHDVACDQMTEPWQHVHLMFYDACRCRGVGEKKAKILFGAVWKFGPHWSWPPPPKGVPMAPESEVTMSHQDLESLKQFVERENPSLERIKQFVEQ